jgi:hypothetical protein
MVRLIFALFSLICGLCFSISAYSQIQPDGNVSDFTGSAACAECHQSIYDRWQDTTMANILVDVDEHPEAVLGDFSDPNPLVTFTPEDIAFTYGSRWKQRYFTQIGSDYFVFPAQWDVLNETWRRYSPERVQNGGPSIIPLIRCNDLQVLFATAATQQTTT